MLLLCCGASLSPSALYLPTVHAAVQSILCSSCFFARVRAFYFCRCALVMLWSIWIYPRINPVNFQSFCLDNLLLEKLTSSSVYGIHFCFLALVLCVVILCFLNHLRYDLLGPSPITSWQINGETMERVTDFIFLDSRITADGDCNHEIKRQLLIGRKAMTSLDSILKSRDITLPPKVHLVKAVVFPVVMCGCESWTVKKAELMLLNCGVGEGSREFLGLQGDPTSPS